MDDLNRKRHAVYKAGDTLNVEYKNNTVLMC